MKYIIPVVCFLVGGVIGMSFQQETRECTVAKHNIDICADAVGLVPEITDACSNIAIDALSGDISNIGEEVKRIDAVTEKVKDLTTKVLAE